MIYEMQRPLICFSPTCIWHIAGTEYFLVSHHELCVFLGSDLYFMAYNA